MKHHYDIETQHSDGHWSRTNWGGENKDAVMYRAKNVYETLLKNKNNPSHIGYGRKAVRVVDTSNTNILQTWYL